MILEFSVENYRSFKEKQTLSMIPDEGKEESMDNIITIDDKFKILKSAVIYGANASGKSNFIKAFQALRDLIIKSADSEPDSEFDAYDPYAFSAETGSKSTVFEINFLLENIRYFYSVAVQSSFVLHENLSFYPRGKETKLFSRKKQEFKWGESLKGQRAVVADLTAENQLFLSKAARNNITQLAKIHHFFSQSCLVIPVLDKWHIDTVYSNRLMKEFLEVQDNETFISNFKSFLKSFDVGIVDITIEKNEDKLSLSDYKISAKHYLYNEKKDIIGSLFRSFNEESTGTRKLFVLGGLILQALMNGKVIIVDEFERSLHPLISSYIINMFNDPKINTNGAQLIIATHDTNLLTNNDFRRDQIWIVEKDQTGVSKLFSVTDIKGVRDDIPFEKWYLSGRFGGVPNIESLNFELTYKHEAD